MKKKKEEKRGEEEKLINKIVFGFELLGFLINNLKSSCIIILLIYSENVFI